MTIEPSATLQASPAKRPAALSSSVRSRIYLYLGFLIVLLNLGAPYGGVIDIPVSFFLKNKLHLQAHEVANFRLLAAIPLYLSCIFGFVRDTWHPFDIKDRGVMLVFGAFSTCLYVVFAFTPISYATLLIAIILLTAAVLFVAGAQNGLTSTIGQQHAMTGRISAVWNIFWSISTVAALVIGGGLSDMLEESGIDQATRTLFLVGAAIMAALTIYALWKPRAVFDNVRDERSLDAHPLQDLKRLVRCWPIYPALLIWLLWNFAPGSATPLQYFLQNTLHADDTQWGLWNAIFIASLIPTFMVFGVLCRKFPLRTLLLWATIVAVPQFLPILFIHSVTGALIAAVPIGLLGGAATAAYLDLIIRSCPRGLQGTTVMMASGLFYVAQRFGDVLGTWVYDYYGSFTPCAIMITCVYALILPVLLFVPKGLTDFADGETSDFESAALKTVD